MNRARRDLLQRLHDARVSLRIEGDRLRFRCPAGAMTPTLRADLAAWKPDLLSEYGERAAIMEYDGGLPRAEAERHAAGLVLAGRGEA